MSGTYKIVWRLTVEHGYFEEKVCPDIIVQLPVESAKLLNRLQLLFKRFNNHQWVLLALEDTPCDSSWEESFFLQLIPVNTSFWDYTLPDNRKDALKYKELRVSLSDRMFRNAAKGKTEDVIVSYRSKSAYWKYILIPCLPDEKKRKIKLVDLSTQLSFERQNQVIVDDKQAEVFRTSVPVCLKNKYNFQLRLLEEMAYGDKLLRQWLDYPQPDAYDAEQSKGEPQTLTCYIYY